MSFINKQQAEAYLQGIYLMDWQADYTTFAEYIDAIGDTLDMLAADIVYAYKVYTDTTHA